MRNKLRRRQGGKNAGCSREEEDGQQNNEVIVLLSESSCFDVEPFQSSTPLDENKRNGSSSGGVEMLPLPNQVLVAPIFSSTFKRNSKNCNEQTSASAKVVISPITQTRIVGVNQSVCKGQLSTLDTRMKDIQATNPTFPVSIVFDTLQKKACQDFTSTENIFEEKTGQEGYGIGQKRQRSSIVAEDSITTTVSSSSNVLQDGLISTPEKPHRSNRLSRTRKLRQEIAKINEESNHEPHTERTNSCNQSPKASHIYSREPFCKDVLWTDKYSPQHSSEVIGNSSPMEKLHCWLKKWKLKTEERRKFKEKEDEENSNDSWDCGDFQDEVGFEDKKEEPLCNTILITGPPGVGKTASVYACAMELGFKVFEVNCSSQRTGRELLTQLKEATQSHLVEASSKDPLKPAYFSSYNTTRCPAKLDSLPMKTVTPKKTVSTSKKKSTQNRSSGRGKANPVTLTSYFKMKAKADHLYHHQLSPAKKLQKKCTDSSPSIDQKLPENNKMATSLILFEEVDVIFEDDVGFLGAIKTFMTTTKRPVILTTNDYLFRERFNSSLEEIIFKTPPMEDVCSYLQLVCLAENVHLDLDDAKTLLKVTRGDVRCCLLQLQLWANSGGGQAKCHSNQQCNCYKGCGANMLGLQSVTQGHLLQLLKNIFETEQQITELLQPMTESLRHGFPLLYSNIELLLHTEGNDRLLFNLDKPQCSWSENQMQHNQQTEKLTRQNVTRSAPKTNSRLHRKKYVVPLTTPSKLNHLPNETSQKQQCSFDKPTRRNCLGALSDYFDTMSFINATFIAAQPLVSGRHLEEFCWTGAKIQDGLLDCMREEQDERDSREESLNIQATVEALGFHVFWRQVSETCNTAQRSRQDTHLKSETLPEPSDTKNIIFPPFCSPIFSQRFELNKTVLGCRHFSVLHNRRAVCVDYMPVIRFMCRTHKKLKSQQKEEAIRCVKSLRTKLGLSKATIQLLTEEFT